MGRTDLFLLNCPTYNDYLDLFVLNADKRYIRNFRFCRFLVELGYRSNAVYTAQQFEDRKMEAHESIFPTRKLTTLFSYKMTSTDPVLQQLAIREELNLQKIISTIIFLKIRKKNGFEISGYIDYEDSLRLASRKGEHYTDWAEIFQERALLKPSRRNLSFYDWKTGFTSYNQSDNYIVIHDFKDGLKFMHRGDHKEFCVDLTKTKYAENYNSGVWYSDVYGYVILYDHIVRKKI